MNKITGILIVVSMMILNAPSVDAKEKKMSYSNSKTYTVNLIRERSSAGSRGTLVEHVEAPNSEMAKRTAEARWPGYRATGATHHVGR